MTTLIDNSKFTVIDEVVRQIEKRKVHFHSRNAHYDGQKRYENTPFLTFWVQKSIKYLQNTPSLYYLCTRVRQQGRTD